VFILKVLKGLCFDTLLQVLILKVVIPQLRLRADRALALLVFPGTFFRIAGCCYQGRRVLRPYLWVVDKNIGLEATGSE
jgi:hypothetical protein